MKIVVEHNGKQITFGSADATYRYLRELHVAEAIGIYIPGSSPSMLEEVHGRLLAAKLRVDADKAAKRRT